MRRIFIVLFFVAMGMLVIAQINQLVWKNERLLYGMSVKEIDSLTYGEIEGMDTFSLFLPSTLTIVKLDTVYVHDTIYVEVLSAGTSEDVHEYVDLGLSVKWATCNIGASKPEEYGDYFSWGEVEQKSYYDWSKYKYCNGLSSNITKYCTKSNFGENGFTDSETKLEGEDDVATINWGSKWRMPTKKEMDELINKCTWEWITYNGVRGYRVIGINRNAIFLPATGYTEKGAHIGIGIFGYYWSSSLYIDDPSNAYYLGFYSDKLYTYFHFRYLGLSIRAVYCE